MKMLNVLATALLAAGSAFASAAPAPTAPAPTAAAPAPAATNPPAATTPAAATTTRPDHHCRDEANEKHLRGAARASFIKKCRADAQAK